MLYRQYMQWVTRNVQGIAQHPVTGEIYFSDHGPQGGDELNVLKKGANYRWPLVTLWDQLRRDRHHKRHSEAGVSSHRSLTGLPPLLYQLLNLQ
jgi:glucose/arabinose dehydrogenase